jgi:hypothetical protein
MFAVLIVRGFISNHGGGCGDSGIWKLLSTGLLPRVQDLHVKRGSAVENIVEEQYEVI